MHHTRFRIKGQDRCFVHHTRMYQDQASWINASYICASWPLVSGSIMYASYIQTSGSRIIHSCMLQDQGSWICVWIYTSYIVNHTHMHQDQGSRIKDINYMHAEDNYHRYMHHTYVHHYHMCKDQGYMHHAYMHQD